MNFFLPLVTREAQAGWIHARIAKRLEEQGYQLTEHRIARVTYWRIGKIASDTVGEYGYNGEIVLAILKNDIGYFVYTYS